MPLLGSKPKPKEAPKNNGDDISPEQWIKNSGHSLKGIFLEWLSEQKLFDIVNGEIKRIKKENQKKKNMSPKDKLAWKRQAAKLSDETIAKFGRDYLGKNSAEETKEYIRDGLNTVASQIKTGNFYKKASLFGDEDMDKFMEDLEAEWDEDEFSSSGENFVPRGEVDDPFNLWAARPDNPLKPNVFEMTKNSNEKNGYYYKMMFKFPMEMFRFTAMKHYFVFSKTKLDKPSKVATEICTKSGQIEKKFKEYVKSEAFKEKFEKQWPSFSKNLKKENGDTFYDKELEKKKNDIWKSLNDLKYVYVIYKNGTDKIEVYFGPYSSLYNVCGLKISLKELGLTAKGESFRKPHREFMSVNDMGNAFDKGVDKLYQMKYGMSQDEYFKKHFKDNRKYPEEPVEQKSKDPHSNDYVLEEDPYYKHLRYFVHIDNEFPGSFQVVVKDKNAKNPSETVKQILSKMDVIEQKWRAYIKSPKIKKEFEAEWESIEETIKTEGKEWLEDIDDNVSIEGGAANDPNNLKKAIWENISDPDTVEIKYKEGSDKLDIHFGYFFEWISQGYDWDLKLSEIGINSTRGESYFGRYKALGEFSKGGSDKNVFTIGLGDIKRYEGLLKAYTSTKKSIRGFISKVIKLANKDINEAKEYANKNNVDSLLDKMSDADNNLLDEMSDLVKGKLEPKNLPTNVAKKMKSYLDKQHKVFTSYDMPEEVYNKWKEIYSSNENDPTMKAINNTARFFEPNTVNGSDYTKVYDKFKDFKVSVQTPVAEMMYLTQKESVLSNDDIEELSNAIEKYNAMKREYGPKLLKVMHTVMNNKEDLDQGEITIDDFDLEEFSASDASYDLEKAIKNIDAINFDKSDYTTKERLRQEFKHLMDVCDFEVIPRSDSEKWKKFSEDNYSSKFSSQYPDIVEFIDRELSYVEKDFLASKEFKNIYKRVGEAKLNDIINKSPIGENFIKRLGGKR